MSFTISQELLIPTFGADKTTSGNYTKATRGFTATGVEFPDEGLSTTSKMELITGFIPNQNASSQTLTLPSVSVSDNTPTPFVMSIRPVNIDTPNILTRGSDSTDSTVYESMNYDANNSTEVDRTSYLFSQVKLGPSTDLQINGKVPVAQYGFKYKLGTDANYTAPADDEVDDDVSASSTTYGYWPVKTTIQAVGTSFDAFILKSGSPVPNDDVLQDLSGHAIKFSEMDDIADSNNKFLSDYLVSPTNQQIVKELTTDNIYFSANSSIPEGTIVFIDQFVHGSVEGVPSTNGTTTTYPTPYSSIQYAYGFYPSYMMQFDAGSTIDVPVTLYDGFSVPAGFSVEAGATTNDITLDTDGTTHIAPITTNLSLANVRADPGFLLPDSVVLSGVILNSSKASIKKGTSSAQMQPMPLGASSDTVHTLNGIQILDGFSLPSELEFISSYETPNDITTHRGTLISKGSILPKGSKSLEGAQIEGELIISAGSAVTDDFDISTPFVITESSSSHLSLDVGTKLKAPFVLPPGTEVTDGNLLPAAFKILMSMGVVLKAGMELLTGTVFGAGAMLYGNIGFKPNGCIPARSTLYGTISIPTGSKLEKDAILNVPLPVPKGVKFNTGDTLHSGTTIREGTSLPPMQDLSSQAGPASASSSGPLSTFTDATSGIQYLVVKAKTAFMSGFIFPVGSILSKTAGNTYFIGTTSGGSADATNGTGTGIAYDLQDGEFSFDTRDRSPAASNFKFSPGIATDSLIVLLTDVVFDTDMLLPLESIDADAGSLLAMNEPFTLISDLVLTSDYVVHGNNSVMWPASQPIPTDFVFSSSYTFTSPGSGTQLDKKLQFNVRTTNEYVLDILTSTSYIKLPPSGYKLESGIKLGLDQAIAGSGGTTNHALKTTIELPKGTKLDTSDGKVVLQHPMSVEDDFTIGASIDTYPRIFLQNGLSLLSGNKTPGDIHVNSGTGLPKNIILPQSVVLAADHVVSEPTYTIPQYSSLEKGTKLSRRTKFPKGFVTPDKIKLHPFLSLTEATSFIVNEENEFSGDIKYPYLVDANGQMGFMKLDNREALNKIAALQSLVEALQINLENH